MEYSFKIKLGIIFLFATFVELVIIIPIFLQKGIPTEKSWYIIIGTFAIVLGISHIYIFLIIPFKYLKSRILKWSIILNPGTTLIFAGISFALLDYPKMQNIFIVSGFLSVLCFLISFFLLIKYLNLLKKKEDKV